MDAEPEFDDIDNNNIYVRWVDEVDGDFWAWAYPKTLYGTQAIGGLLSFVRDKVNSSERFAGILTHELLHLLRLKHMNALSVMASMPYLPYEYQAMPTLTDMQALGSGWPGPTPKLISPIYDYGKEDPDKFILLIQTIEALGGSYSLYVHGEIVNGKVGMYALPAQVSPETTHSGATAKLLPDERIEIPIRYMGASLTIDAKIVETNSKWLFQDVEIKPFST